MRDILHDIIMRPEDVQKREFLSRRNWYDRDVSRFQIDMTKPLQKPQFLLASNGVPFAMLKGFLCITGQAGHGKTATIALLIATILKGEIGNLTYEQKEEIPNPKVLYIDTEQEEYYTKFLAHRVCAMIGWEREQNHEQLQLFHLREETDVKDRWADIIKIIDNIHPTLVIIDGLLDVVNNPNEMEECTPIIMECLAIATHYKIALWAVIHQNPNSNSKMSGNLGSIAERKASDVLATKLIDDKGEPYYEVKHLKARGKRPDAWKFKITDPLALPCPIVSITQTPEDKDPEHEKAKRMQELDAKYGALNFPREGLTPYKIKEALGDKKKNDKSKTLKECEEMIEYGMMSVSYNESNVMRYHYHGITDTKQPTQCQLEFEGQEPESNNNEGNTALPFPTGSREAPF